MASRPCPYHKYTLLLIQHLDLVTATKRATRALNKSTGTGGRAIQRIVGAAGCLVRGIGVLFGWFAQKIEGNSWFRWGLCPIYQLKSATAAQSCKGSGPRTVSFEAQSSGFGDHPFVQKATYGQGATPSRRLDLLWHTAGGHSWTRNLL